ncbi:MAG: CCA tRNA nucleotidyltransferase [Candidatus Methanomethylicaceae archaeon]
MSSIDDVLREVLPRVKPTPEDRRRVERVVELIKTRIEEEAKARGISVKVEIEGSLAKDTWVASDKDIDIFIIFPHGTARELAKELGLELAKAGAGEGWRLGYAEHPYVEASIEGYTVDIVPGVEMKEGERPATAVDRTPLHTRFILSKMNDETRDDVRLLKQFMKGVGVYGAELKVGGFSGYLCELLLLNYGSFEGVLRGASGWRESTVIDYMKYYDRGVAEKIFDSPLVVIDPVDKRRNAAAAVSVQCYSTFIAASKHFLEEPSVEYFFPKIQGGEIDEALRGSKVRGTSLVLIKTGCPKLASDILWGEAQKSLLRCVRLLEDYDFQVLDYKPLSDEKDYVAFLLELEERRVREGRAHRGPKVWYHEEVKKFLGKHLAGRKILAGPFIRKDRWYVELKRKYTDVRDLLYGEMPKLQMSKHIMEEVRKRFQVYVDDEIGEACAEIHGLGEEVFKFVRKRPAWLR